MAMKRIRSSWRGAERGNKATPAQNGQPAPSLHTYPADDYPVFPEDKSTFPVFPRPAARPRRWPEAPTATCVAGRTAPNIPADQKPNHVALVMDGNGRWATQRGLPRTEGHKMGEVVLIDIICGAIEIGIKWLTVYAFSTENWKRSTEEVRFLMGFNRDVVRRRREILDHMGVRMRWAGAATTHVAQRDQRTRNRREYDVEQRRHHHQLLRQLRRSLRDRRSRKRHRTRRRPRAD